MDIKSDIKKRPDKTTRRFVYCIFKLLFVFIVDYHKPFEQKLIVNDDVTLAVRDYYLCHTACGNHSAFFTKLVFYPLYNSVNACGALLWIIPLFIQSIVLVPMTFLGGTRLMKGSCEALPESESREVLSRYYHSAYEKFFSLSITDMVVAVPISIIMIGTG